jgi:hypothetical protein
MIHKFPYKSFNPRTLTKIFQEYAIGAITQDKQAFLDDEAIAQLHVSEDCMNFLGFFGPVFLAFFMYYFFILLLL